MKRNHEEENDETDHQEKKTEHDRLSRYYSNYGEEAIKGFSVLDLKIVHVRDQIDLWLYENQFAKVEGLLVGLLYSDRQFATEVVLWRSRWEKQEEESLLEAIIDREYGLEPPISLLRLVVDLAPSVLTQASGLGHPPLHTAIYDADHASLDGWKMSPDGWKAGRSLAVVKFLMEADQSKSSWTSRSVFTALERSAFRQDEGIARFLLSFPEIRKELTENRGGPLYYVSRDLIDEKDEEYKPIHPWIKFWLMETAKAMTGSTPRSISHCIDICHEKVHNEELLRKHCRYD